MGPQTWGGPQSSHPHGYYMPGPQAWGGPPSSQVDTLPPSLHHPSPYWKVFISSILCCFAQSSKVQSALLNEFKERLLLMKANSAHLSMELLKVLYLRVELCRGMDSTKRGEAHRAAGRGMVNPRGTGLPISPPLGSTDPRMVATARGPLHSSTRAPARR